ncbi:MAG TPA: SIS domain-containing protein [Blastocatellia bacterium]|nr:SIS domain-containing protein [Blastocatellia bacterium]
MAKRLHPNSMARLPLQPAELVEDEALSRGKVEAAESNGASHNGSSASGHISPLNPTEAIETFFELAIKELAAMRTRAEVEAIERAAELIIECESRGGRVHVTGIGKSEHVARYIASVLSSTGTAAYFLHATECVHGSAGQVRDCDITIAISNSGTTPELMCAVDALRALGIKIIGVSGDRESPLAHAAEVLLYAGVENEGGVLNLVPRASILAKLYILCALTVALEARKGLTREQYALWHPGGALGRLARGE